MSTEAEEIQRRVSASVRDMLNEYRLQASAGPVTDKALEEIIFRAGPQRAAMLPSLVRMLLATFIEEVAGADGSGHAGD
jgi:hypothetical protein